MIPIGAELELCVKLNRHGAERRIDFVIVLSINDGICNQGPVELIGGFHDEPGIGSSRYRVGSSQVIMGLALQ